MEKRLVEDAEKNFRRNFRTLRVKQKIEQKELAVKMNISQQEISAIETGRRRITASIVEAAAQALDTTQDELLAETSTDVIAKELALRMIAAADKLYVTRLDLADVRLLEYSLNMIERIILR